MIIIIHCHQHTRDLSPCLLCFLLWTSINIWQSWDPFQWRCTAVRSFGFIAVLWGNTPTPTKTSFVSQNRIYGRPHLIKRFAHCWERDITTVMESSSETGLQLNVDKCEIITDDFTVYECLVALASGAKMCQNRTHWFRAFFQDRLRSAKTFPLLHTRTTRYRNSFLPFVLVNFQ